MDIPLRWRLVVINIVTFIVRGRDKRQAVRQQRRVSEQQLLVLCALGGWGGAWLAMTRFRHKTIKSAFLWKFWLIVVVWIGMISVFLTRGTA